VLRVATWNVNSLKARLERVEEWVEQVQPDVLCLQETKMADTAFPAMAFQALGYDAVHHGDGRWNGVAIASRVGIDHVQAGFRDGPVNAETRLLAATCGGARVITVYVPNGRAVGHEQYDAKLAWMHQLADEVVADHDPNRELLVCGDFNVAPDDRDVWDPAAAHGGTHVSPPEREALARLTEWGLADVFRLHYDAGGLYSWWDYRAGHFHKGFGMRIDLMLVSRPLAERSVAALIDRNARKGKAPSDHAPLVADFRDTTDNTASP
jgi:exodeoxyribonuclease-3